MQNLRVLTYTERPPVVRTPGTSYYQKALRLINPDDPSLTNCPTSEPNLLHTPNATDRSSRFSRLASNTASLNSSPCSTLLTPTPTLKRRNDSSLSSSSVNSVTSNDFLSVSILSPSDPAFCETLSFSTFEHEVSQQALAIYCQFQADQATFYLCTFDSPVTFTVCINSKQKFLKFMSFILTLPLISHEFSSTLLTLADVFQLTQDDFLLVSRCLTNSIIIDLDIVLFHCCNEILPKQLSSILGFSYLQIPPNFWNFLTDCLSELSSFSTSQPRSQFSELLVVDNADSLNTVLNKCLQSSTQSFSPQLPPSLLLDLLINSLFIQMSFIGILHYPNVLRAHQQVITNRLNQIEQEAHSLVGREFLLSSPQQVSSLLFSTLKCKLPDGLQCERTSTNTSDRMLKLLQDQHPVIQLILLHRELSKLNSFYIHGLTKDIPEQSDSPFVIHSQWSLTSAETGRVACKNPNLQNLPSRPYIVDNNVVDVRDSFKSRDGFTFVSADFHHLELRTLAILSKDDVLISLLSASTDVYCSIASRFFSTEVDQIDQSQRNLTKRLCYALVYGAGPQKLSEELGISVEQASQYMQEFSPLICPRLKDLVSSVTMGAIQHSPPTVVLPDGRRRVIMDLTSSKPAMQKRAARSAFNSFIQGFASFLVKKSFLAANYHLAHFNARPVLHIHDEVVFEVPTAVATDFEQHLKVILEESLTNSWLKFPVSTCIGSSLSLLKQ
ncbi:hypothetical protein P9112_008031 [Eukaryota sp. TZLM1-RC]